jgi:hypothetical protein
MNFFVFTLILEPPFPNVKRFCERRTDSGHVRAVWQTSVTVGGSSFPQCDKEKGGQRGTVNTVERGGMSCTQNLNIPRFVIYFEVLVVVRTAN